MSYVWINGQLVDKSEAKISVFDHGFLYGDGVWEHFRAFGGKLFRPEGFQLLFVSANTCRIDIPYSQQELTAAITATLQANNRDDGYIRVIVTRGQGTIGPDPRKLEPHVIVIAEEYQPFPLDLYEHGIHAITMQAYPRPLFTHARLLGQPQVAIAKSQALAQGCLEAILINVFEGFGGCIEGSLSAVQEGSIGPVLSTPFDPALFALNEIIEAETISKAQPNTNATKESLYEADELVLSGITCGIIGIVQVDGKPIGTGREGPITKRIREAYRKLTRGEA